MAAGHTCPAGHRTPFRQIGRSQTALRRADTSFGRHKLHHELQQLPKSVARARVSADAEEVRRGVHM